MIAMAIAAISIARIRATSGIISLCRRNLRDRNRRKIRRCCKRMDNSLEPHPLSDLPGPGLDGLVWATGERRVNVAASNARGVFHVDTVSVALADPVSPNETPLVLPGPLLVLAQRVKVVTWVSPKFVARCRSLLLVQSVALLLWSREAKAGLDLPDGSWLTGGQR